MAHSPGRTTLARRKIPARLGPYTLGEKIGEGGMGVVYRAVDTRTGATVALKLLQPRQPARRDIVQRFYQEAMSAVELRHPHIVGAYEAGEEQGFHFYAMEFEEGESLAAQIEREGPLPWRRSVEIARQVALGLQHAHKFGCIHRDIKPANILITAGGQARIVDFGLIKQTLLSRRLLRTETGVALGTPYYISPEQARGAGSLDGRADIYSLGATLFHILTGAPPFTGRNAPEVLLLHATQPLPDPRDVQPDIPESLVAILKKMTAKDRAARYSDCAQLLKDLEGVG